MNEVQKTTLAESIRERGYGGEHVAQTRPGGVTFVAVLNIIGGSIVALLGLALATPLSPGYGLVLVGSAAFAIVVAAGLLKLQNWARILAMVGYGINIVTGLINLAGGSPAGLLQIGIAAAVIFYLCRPQVRECFSGL